MPKLLLPIIVTAFFIMATVGAARAVTYNNSISGTATTYNLINGGRDIAKTKVRVCAENVSGSILISLKRKHCTRFTQTTQAQEDVPYTLRVPDGTYIVYAEKRYKDYLSRGFYTVGGESAECLHDNNPCAHDLSVVKVKYGEKVNDLNPNDWQIP